MVRSRTVCPQERNRNLGEPPWRSMDMFEATAGSVRSVGLSAMALAAALAFPGSAFAAEPASAPTFTKDIAPIFQDKCEACHRPDSIAPMSLVSFEESRPWARSIKGRVQARQM